MLDKKDQIILDCLMHDCRISTLFLSKVTKLAQSSVVYRIQRLEKKGYISKYDAMIYYPLLPLPLEIFFLTVPSAFQEQFESDMYFNKNIASVFRLLHKRNYFLFTFQNNLQREKLLAYLSHYGCYFDSFTIKKEEFIPFSVYGTNVDIPVKKKLYKPLSLDTSDVAIIKVVTNGGGRDSILEIARKTHLSYDVVLYRFKRLVKHNYFALFFAQPSPSIFGLQVDMVVIKTKSTSFQKAYEVFASTKKCPYCMEAEPGVFFTQLLTKSFVEYKMVLEKIRTGFGDDILEWTIYNTKEWLFVNRVPFENMLPEEKRKEQLPSLIVQQPVSKKEVF